MPFTNIATHLTSIEFSLNFKLSLNYLMLSDEKRSAMKVITEIVNELKLKHANHLVFLSAFTNLRQMSCEHTFYILKIAHNVTLNIIAYNGVNQIESAQKTNGLTMNVKRMMVLALATIVSHHPFL